MPPIKTSNRFVSAEKGEIRTCKPTKYLEYQAKMSDFIASETG